MQMKEKDLASKHLTNVYWNFPFAFGEKSKMLRYIRLNFQGGICTVIQGSVNGALFFILNNFLTVK